MAYREAPERHPAPAVIAPPPKRIVVTTYPVWALALILVACIGIGIGATFLSLTSTSFVCERLSSGGPPRCDVRDHSGGATRRFQFELRRGALKVAERESDDAKYLVIATPNGAAYGSVTQEFGESVVSGADAFLASNAPRWEATHEGSRGPYGYGPLGALAGLVIAVLMRPRAIVIRPAVGTLQAGGLSVPLSSIRSVAVEDIDDSSFCRLVLRTRDGARHVIAQATPQKAKAAVREVHLALRAVRGRAADEDAEVKKAFHEAAEEGGGPFAKWSALDDGARRDRMEALLSTVSVDERTIVHKASGIELRGTCRGTPIRLMFDPTDPSGVEVQALAKSDLAVLELEYDPEALEPVTARDGDPTFFGPGVFTTSKKGPDTFRALPFDLQARIVTTMRAEGLRSIRVSRKDTILSTRGGLRDRDDPKAHLDTLVDLAATIAENVSKQRRSGTAS